MPKAFIKNIDKIVKQKVNQLAIKPDIKLAVFKNNKKRFYTTPAHDEKNELVLFKMLISNEKSDALSFKKEIVVEKKLKIIPIIKSNNKQMPYWMLRKYLTGPILGYHFKIHPTGLKKNMPDKIAQLLTDYQKNKPEIKLDKKTYNDYLKVMKKMERKLKALKDFSINFPKIYLFFKKYKNEFNSYYLAHGDFTLANFFVHQQKIYLTDWEHIRYDNIAADINRLWIQTYKYPKWRQNLILSFLKKLPNNKQENFKKMFCLMAINEAVSEFVGEALKTKKQTELKKSALKTIKLGITSFDELVNS